MMLYQTTSQFCNGNISKDYFKYLANIGENFYARNKHLLDFYGCNITFTFKNDRDPEYSFNAITNALKSLLKEDDPQYEENYYFPEDFTHDDLIEYINNRNTIINVITGNIKIKVKDGYESFSYLNDYKNRFLLSLIHDIYNTKSLNSSIDLLNTIQFDPRVTEIIRRIMYNRCIFSSKMSELFRIIQDEFMDYTIKSMRDALYLILHQDILFRDEKQEYLFMFLIWFRFKLKTFDSFDDFKTTFYV